MAETVSQNPPVHARLEVFIEPGFGPPDRTQMCGARSVKIADVGKIKNLPIRLILRRLPLNRAPRMPIVASLLRLGFDGPFLILNFHMMLRDSHGFDF